MRTAPRQRHARSASAFTLVEVLVATSVLILLLALVSQLVNSASKITTQSGKHLDADTQARMVFDRMSVDFANIISRSDVDVLFSKATGNDALFFLSQAPAYSGTDSGLSGAALVGYRVTDTNGGASSYAPVYSLERLGQGLVWSGTSNGTATVPGSVVFHSGTANATNTLVQNWAAEVGSAPYTRGASSCYASIGDQVFRMEICFQVKHLTNGSVDGVVYSNYPVAVSSATTVAGGIPFGGSVGARWYDSTANRAYRCTGANAGGAVWQPNGLNDVVSIVATLAILDSNSRKLVSGGAYASLISSVFPDPSEADLNASPAILPAATWKTKLENALKNNTIGIPKAAASQIRIYQRFFYLNNN